MIVAVSVKQRKNKGKYNKGKHGQAMGYLWWGF